MEHWHANERVMRYLKRTIKLGLHYKRFPAVLEGYRDADWNTLSDDSKATSSYIFSIAGGAVSWKSKKLTILLVEIPLWESKLAEKLTCRDSVMGKTDTSCVDPLR